MLPGGVEPWCRRVKQWWLEGRQLPSALLSPSVVSADMKAKQFLDKRHTYAPQSMAVIHC